MAVGSAIGMAGRLGRILRARNTPVRSRRSRQITKLSNQRLASLSLKSVTSPRFLTTCERFFLSFADSGGIGLTFALCSLCKLIHSPWPRWTNLQISAIPPVHSTSIVLVMSFSSIGFGYSLSIIATTLAQPSFISYFRLGTRSNATQLVATMNGVYQAGGLLAVFTISWFADRLGRRAAITVSALIKLVAGACLVGSVNVAMFILFRFVSSAGAFMGAAADPIWMNEVVPPNVRGVLVDIHSVGLLAGYMLSSWVGYGFYHCHALNGAQWRVPLAFQCLPVALLLLGLWWMPESPRWLFIGNQFEEAERTLRNFTLRKQQPLNQFKFNVRWRSTEDSTAPIDLCSPNQPIASERFWHSS